jgi:type I restriction enzyme, S subunit
MNNFLSENFSIPKTNWKKVKLGDVVFEPKESVKDPIKEEIEHVVGLEHIESKDIHLLRSANIEQSTTFTKKFAVGDVLFGRRRAYLKKAAQAKFKGICSGDITVMRAKKELLPELLPFLVNNDKFFDYAVTHSAGGLSPRVKFKDLADYEFFLPPKDQQVKLADLLWSLEDVIAADKGLLGKLRLSLQANIEEFVPRNRESKWTLGKMVKIRKGLTYTSDDYSNENDGIPLLSLKSIEKGGGFNENGIKHYSGNYKSEHFVNDNDLVIACTDITRNGDVVGYPLHPAVYKSKKMLFTMDLLSLEIIDENLMRDYLYYALKARWVHWFLYAYSPGTTVLHLDTTGLKKLKIPRFDLREQTIFVSKLKNLESSINNVLKKIEHSSLMQSNIINQVF